MCIIAYYKEDNLHSKKVDSATGQPATECCGVISVLIKLIFAFKLVQ